MPGESQRCPPSPAALGEPHPHARFQERLSDGALKGQGRRGPRCPGRFSAGPSRLIPGQPAIPRRQPRWAWGRLTSRGPPLPISIIPHFPSTRNLHAPFCQAKAVQWGTHSPPSGLPKDDSANSPHLPTILPSLGGVQIAVTFSTSPHPQGLRYRAWAQSWSSAALAARSVLPSNRPATPLFSPACWVPRLGAELELRRSGSSLGPSQ